MYTIGLIGGVASGKSTVAKMLEDRGASVLDADRAAHQVLERADVIDSLVERWGPSILDSQGQVDRSVIAQKVFGSSDEVTEERSFLESIVHPLTRDNMERMRRELTSQGKKVFVIDAPLLLEAGWNSFCDLVVMVDTPRGRRLENASSRGWTAEELNRRESSQMDLSNKKKHSDYIISNKGSLESTRRQVELMWNKTVQPNLDN